MTKKGFWCSKLNWIKFCRGSEPLALGFGEPARILEVIPAHPEAHKCGVHGRRALAPSSETLVNTVLDSDTQTVSTVFKDLYFDYLCNTNGCQKVVLLNFGGNGHLFQSEIKIF